MDFRIREREDSRGSHRHNNKHSMRRESNATSGGNILTGPREANFDFTAEKKFLFTESRQLWFRAEFFNAFNHPQFTIPASTIGSTELGTISAIARPSLQIQFALKLLFCAIVYHSATDPS
jgi:hypothetical protein